MTSPVNRDSDISLLKQTSAELLATSLLRLHVQSQIGPSDKNLPIAAIDPVANDHQRKLLTDKFRAISKQQQHVEGSGSRRRHQLEINEMSRPQLKKTSFRATQGFDIRNIN